MRYKPTSRAANDNGHPYSVYGIIEGSNEWYVQTEVFISKAGLDSVSPDSVYYWPGTDSITFYSFSPNQDAAMQVQDFSSNPPKLTITYEPQGDGNDFTIATPNKQGRLADGTNPKVPLVFKHMLAAIQISIEVSPELHTAGYSLNNNVYNAPEGDGYTAILQVPYSIGTINAVDSNPTWSNVSGPAKKFTNNITYYVIPQTINTTESDTCTTQFSNIWLYRNDIVVFDNLLMQYTLKDNDIPDNEFKMGYMYRLNFTFTTDSHQVGGDPIFGDEIIFGSTVEPWSDGGNDNITID